MGTTNTRLNLEDKIARYLGERERVILEIIRISEGIDVLASRRDRLTKLDGLIGAAKMILVDGDPDWTGDHIKAKRKTDHNSPIPYGELGRTGLEVLRDGPPEGMRSRDVAREVMIRFNLDPTDRALLDKVANSLGQYLKGNDGDLVESDGERFYKRWRLIRRK